MKRGWRLSTLVALSFLAWASMAVAQTEPSVEPLGPPAPPPPAPPPAYPSYAYPPAQPYGAYPRGPARLRYEDGDPIPVGYHVVHRTRQGPVIAGTIVFFVSYGIALSVAMIDDFKHQTSSLAVPVAGPWLMMYRRSQPDCDSQTGNGCIEQSLETILRFYLAIDGLAQAAGVGLFGFGMAGRNILVRDDSYAYVRVVPTPVGSSGYGATLIGRF